MNQAVFLDLPRAGSSPIYVMPRAVRKLRCQYNRDFRPGIARSKDSEPEGPVSLGVISSLAPRLTGDFLRECRAKFPKIRIRVSDGDTQTLESKIASTSITLAVLSEDEFLTALSRIPLFRQRLYFLSHTPVPDVSDVISLKRLAEFPLVLPAPTNARRVMIERMFAEAKLTLNLALEADSLASEIWAVRNGLGCTVLPIGDTSHFGSNALAKPLLIEPPMAFTCSIVYLADLPLTTAGEAVRDLLMAFIERRVSQPDMPGVEWIAKS